MKHYKHNYLFLMLSLALAVNNTHAMEPEPKWGLGFVALVGGILLGKIALNTLWQQSEPFPLGELPQDIQKEIIILLSLSTQAKILEEAAQPIRALAQVNKELNALINDPQFSTQLITNLAQRFKKDLSNNRDLIELCCTLQTQGSFRYLASMADHYDIIGNTPLMTTLLMGPDWIKNNYNCLQNVIKASSASINLNPTSRYAVYARTPLLLALSSADIHINKPRSGWNYQIIRDIKQTTELYAKVIQLLLDNGADPELANPGGITPLQTAMKTGSREIIDLIQNAINKKHGKKRG